MTRLLLDDHLLRDVLADDVSDELDQLLGIYEPATTNHYLFRLCKSVVSARGGKLTGSWPSEQRRALGQRLLTLPSEIEIVPVTRSIYTCGLWNAATAACARMARASATTSFSLNQPSWPP